MDRRDGCFRIDRGVENSTEDQQHVEQRVVDLAIGCEVLQTIREERELATPISPALPHRAQRSVDYLRTTCTRERTSPSTPTSPP